MPASFELEAIKAQVVASRTFVYSRLLSVDNTTNTQVYLDDEKMKVSWSDHYEEYKEKVQKAIVETKGCLLYTSPYKCHSYHPFYLYYIIYIIFIQYILLLILFIPHHITFHSKIIDV